MVTTLPGSDSGWTRLFSVQKKMSTRVVAVSKWFAMYGMVVGVDNNVSAIAQEVGPGCFMRQPRHHSA